MNLALFDFDGTLTTEDTFTKFIEIYTPRSKYFFGLFKLFPWILGYKMNLVRGTNIRQKIVKTAFSGMSQQVLEDYGDEFSKCYLDTVLRKDSFKVFKAHIEKGDKVVIVSASLDLYLRSWCKKHDVELICAEIEFDDGFCTGNYLKGDCSGPSKASKVKQSFDLSKFDEISAYGDTKEDRELLSLANYQFMKGKLVSKT